MPLVRTHAATWLKDNTNNCLSPIANGMVERFHRQLKAALKTSSDPTNWVDMLHIMVLLGI